MNLEDPALTRVVAQLEKGENVGNYFLSKEFCIVGPGAEENLSLWFPQRRHPLFSPIFTSNP